MVQQLEVKGAGDTRVNGVYEAYNKYKQKTLWRKRGCWAKWNVDDGDEYYNVDDGEWVYYNQRHWHIMKDGTTIYKSASTTKKPPSKGWQSERRVWRPAPSSVSVKNKLKFKVNDVVIDGDGDEGTIIEIDRKDADGKYYNVQLRGQLSNYWYKEDALTLKDRPKEPKEPKSRGYNAPIRTRKQIYELFDKYDKRGVGYLRASDVRSLLLDHGLATNVSQARTITSQVFNEHDNNDNDRLEIDEFVEWYINELQGLGPVSHYSKWKRADIRRYFDRYDTNGDGVVDVSELKGLLRDASVPEYDVTRLAREIRDEHDTNWSGTLNFSEFMEWWERDASRWGAHITDWIGKYGDYKTWSRSTIRKVFQSFDKNDDGLLQISELRRFLTSIGVKRSDTTRLVNKVLDRYDYTSNDALTLVEFTDWYLDDIISGAGPVSAEYEKWDDAQLEKLFRDYDTNGDGLISIREMKRLLLDNGVPSHKAARMARRIQDVFSGEADGVRLSDGLDMEEFKSWYKSDLYKGPDLTKYGNLPNSRLKQLFNTYADDFDPELTLYQVRQLLRSVDIPQSLIEKGLERLRNKHRRKQNWTKRIDIDEFTEWYAANFKTKSASRHTGPYYKGDCVQRRSDGSTGVVVRRDGTRYRVRWDTSGDESWVQRDRIGEAVKSKAENLTVWDLEKGDRVAKKRGGSQGKVIAIYKQSQQVRVSWDKGSATTLDPSTLRRALKFNVGDEVVDNDNYDVGIVVSRRLNDAAGKIYRVQYDDGGRSTWQSGARLKLRTRSNDVRNKKRITKMLDDKNQQIDELRSLKEQVTSTIDKQIAELEDELDKLNDIVRQPTVRKGRTTAVTTKTDLRNRILKILDS